MSEQITIPVELAVLLTQLVQLAAERNAFKLEDYAAVAQINEQLKFHIQNSKVTAPPAVPEKKTPAHKPVVEAHPVVVEDAEPKVFEYAE